MAAHMYACNTVLMKNKSIQDYTTSSLIRYSLYYLRSPRIGAIENHLKTVYWLSEV